MGMSTNSYTIAQRAIFSLLDEAGSEDAAALINTVFLGLRSREEFKRIGAELLSLAELGLIELRMELEHSLGEALDKQEQRDLLLSLDSKFLWSEAEQLWKWQLEERAVIQLTDFGKSEVEAVLTEHGWQSPIGNG
ncbi:MAG: hypothetical protein ISS15_19425 [Alphaproteobacteria bacterium]|nr:hypothetical protein [Alphaproteobacteria bacterium]MBL6939916.1 hypothetical protein [Alphaproteobacteria bacterium]MBL7099834.1 hypothetical protein [Alphaproteobacteria bacterium]